MKIILSHDVDHLYWHDHLFDTWWPGLIIRTLKDLVNGELELITAKRRVFPGKNLNNISKLCTFLIGKGIPATFFFGMRKGLNLSYSYKKTGPILNLLLKNNFHIGLHGIAFNNIHLMSEERTRLFNISGFEPKGIRTHYLRMDDSTYDCMSSLGYQFDSSQNKIDFPCKYGNIWSIPISVMDVDMIHGSGKENLQIAVDKTLSRIESAENKGIPYFVINFHDYYFSDSYPVFHAYFLWLIEYLLRFHYEFTSFDQAINQLNSL